MNLIPLSRLDRMQMRAEYELDTEDDGRSSPVSAGDVLDLVAEDRTLRAREPCWVDARLIRTLLPFIEGRLA